MTMFNGFEFLTFRFSRTLPECPHEYASRQREDPAAEVAYVELFERIMAEGVREFAPERPGKRRYKNRYWYPGDGYKYWAMTSSVSFSLIINRTLVAIYDGDNNPLPDAVEKASKAAAMIGKWPAAERRTVTLVRALELGVAGAASRP